MTKKEHSTVLKSYSDSYIQQVSSMSSSRVGGELRWISDMAKGKVIYLGPEEVQKKASKMVDGSMLYFTRKLWRSLTEEDKAERAQELNIPVEELDEYYLLGEANIRLHEFMLAGYGFTAKEQYIEERGFDNFIAFIRGSADKMFKDSTKKKWWHFE